METKNPIQVADRLFLVLETLAETGPVTLAELCSHLDLNKSTVHRLLCSLIYMGYVKQEGETGKYSLSFKLLALSNKLLARMDILDTVRPYLKKLSRLTGETVHFVQREHTDAVYIYKEESYQNSIRMVSKVGSRIPLYCSGVGKAIAADLDEAQIKALWENSSIQKLTPVSYTHLDVYKRQGPDGTLFHVLNIFFYNIFFFLFFLRFPCGNFHPVPSLCHAVCYFFFCQFTLIKIYLHAVCQ